MATQVKDTPVLLGKDAQRFNDAIMESAIKKISPEERQKLQESFNRFKVVNDKK